MQLLCFIKGIIQSIIHFQTISGHEYQEIYNNEDIQILKCINCNHLSVGFKKGE